MPDSQPRATVIGGGPAGLMAAEVLAQGGARVTVHDRMPSLGRKLLMAGRGGLNLTHSEPFPDFLGRYGDAARRLTPVLEAFPPEALRVWAQDLGQETFVGSSGRVFPQAMKASPLLRAWLARLESLGVAVRARSAWRGWTADGRLDFSDGSEAADVTVLALGGASWPRLGSDGAWAPILAGRGVGITPLRPANAGVEIPWTPLFAGRFAGQPLKAVALSFGGRRVAGEVMISAYGLEGGAVYALSAAIRDALDAGDPAELRLDLRPGRTPEEIARRLAGGRAGETLSNRLRKALALSPAEVGLLREAAGRDLPTDPQSLAALIKAAPLRARGMRPLARAISTAGGVALDAVDDQLMLRTLPGVYVAGEMLDWEAPTGGYLLQACFASGAWAGRAALRRLATRS